jgi:metal-sulfur cluster biosynthetic enzyme
MTPATISAVLEKVHDPELGIDIVALGLIYDIWSDDAAIVVQMTTTTPFCPMSEAIVESAQALLQEEYPAARVRVEVVSTPPWDVGMLDDRARNLLGIR